MRLSYVDTAKFLAIFFVLVGHADMSSGISSFFFSFHVQMFFLLYGYVHIRKEYSWEGFSIKTKKLIKRLLVPFFVLVFLLGHPLSLISIVKSLWGSIWIVYYAGASHLWFLPCFFISAVIFEFIRSKHLQSYIEFIILALLGTISAYANFDNDLSLSLWGGKIIHFTYFTPEVVKNEYFIGFPYHFNIALSGVIFMYAGTYLREIERKIKFFQKRAVIITMIISFLIGFVSYCTNQTFLSDSLGYKIVSMGAAFYGNYLLFLLTSISLSIAFLSLAKIIDNKFFSYIGKYTMEIYAFHMVFLPYTTLFLQKLHFPLLGGFSSAVVCMLICILAIPVIDYLLPSLNASKKEIKLIGK